MPASTLSFHLKALMQTGLVAQRREGRHLICTAQTGAIRALSDFLLNQCCTEGTGDESGEDEPMKLDLPDPETPVMPVITPRGSSISIPRRLLWRAPLISIQRCGSRGRRSSGTAIVLRPEI